MLNIIKGFWLSDEAPLDNYFIKENDHLLVKERFITLNFHSAEEILNLIEIHIVI